MAKRTEIRTYIAQAIALNEILDAEDIYMSKFDELDAEKLPAIKIYPAKGNHMADSMDSFEDNLEIKIEIKSTDKGGIYADLIAEELCEDVIETIRNLETDITDDQQVVEEVWHYDADNSDPIVMVELTVDVTMKG